ncbi:MAG TPA: transcriptional regulator [Glaciecola sp.]|mgnify:CR=1 FL=1|jgi:excisionase family DNA binding protein|nr:transcriptional regulator [Glaciecola sp.]
MSMSNNRLITTKQLCEQIGVNKVTVWRWTRSGFLPEPYRLKGQVRWRQKSIDAWLEEQLLMHKESK